MEEKIGYIYCFQLDTNDFSLRKKIGYTTTSLEKRAAELFTTGSFYRIKCVLAKRVSNPCEKEKQVHKMLEKYRVYSNREFFDVDIEEVRNAMDTLDGEYVDLDKDKEEKIIKDDSNQKNMIKNDKKNEHVTDVEIDFQCKRCGYSSIRKYDLKKHLQKKYVCEPLFNDINIETLLHELELKEHKGYVCEFCNKVYSSPQSKYIHKQKCLQKSSNKNKEIIKLKNKIKELNSKTIPIQNITNHIHINCIGYEKIETSKEIHA